MAGRPRGTRYDYPQIDYHFRLSVEAHTLLRQMAAELDTTLKACVIAAVLQTLDPTQQTPDWENLPPVLKG